MIKSLIEDAREIKQRSKFQAFLFISLVLLWFMVAIGVAFIVTATIITNPISLIPISIFLLLALLIQKYLI